jgi:hypothetical protein
MEYPPMLFLPPDRIFRKSIGGEDYSKYVYP